MRGKEPGNGVCEKKRQILKLGARRASQAIQSSVRLQARDVPDIVTMPKVMGNGAPLAAVVTTPKIAAAIAQRTHLICSVSIPSCVQRRNDELV
jgi:hypothetical protein